MIRSVVCIVYTSLVDQRFNCRFTDSCLSLAYQQECFFCHKACVVAFDMSWCVIV